jgi:hypothetical protein
MINLQPLLAIIYKNKNSSRITIIKTRICKNKQIKTTTTKIIMISITITITITITIIKLSLHKIINNKNRIHKLNKLINIYIILLQKKSNIGLGIVCLQRSKNVSF